MKFFVTLSYDGSKYFGLQKLKNKKTIQGEIENCLSKMNEKNVKVVFSGRTDKGVHALNQKCHFEIDKPTNSYKLRYYLNNSTSPYIYIKSCKEIYDKNFHARFSVKNKTYIYKINVGEYDAILNDYFYNYNKQLNIKKMKVASKKLLGEHDFKAFVTGKHLNTVTVIEAIEISKYNDIIEFTIKGKAFYTYMVRNIVSMLVLVGSNKCDLSIIDKMLSSKKRVIEYCPAPPGGLYLKDVQY